jgi:hypothetical protein
MRLTLAGTQQDIKTANEILAISTYQKPVQNEMENELSVHSKADANRGHFLLYLSLKWPKKRPVIPLVKVNAVPVTKPYWTWLRLRPILMFVLDVVPTYM